MAEFGAGQLKERVAWDKRLPGDDGYGGRQTKYAEQFDCRAGFIPLRGGEAVLAARLVGRQPIIVRVRAETRTRAIEHGWRMRDARKGAWEGDGDARRWLGTIYLVKAVTVSKESPLFLDVLVESEGTI